MARYRVEVTGQLDMDYEVEADDATDACAIAEEQFINDTAVMWSSVDAWDAEEIKE